MARWRTGSSGSTERTGLSAGSTTVTASIVEALTKVMAKMLENCVLATDVRYCGEMMRDIVCLEGDPFNSSASPVWAGPIAHS